MSSFRREMEQAEAKHRKNIRSFTKLFQDPEAARQVLGNKLAAEDDAAPTMTCSLIDNATVDHAFFYFESCFYEWAPVRRLNLLAAAEVINAIILNDTLLTGPELSAKWYGEPLLQTARSLVLPTDDRLTWPEVFAALSLARHHTIKLIEDPSFDISCLMNAGEKELSRSTLLKKVEAITPRAAHLSPHKLPPLVDDDEFYYADLSYGVLGPTTAELTVLDRDGGAQARLGEELYHITRGRDSVVPEEAAEHFAAHLLYRTQLYLILTDLIGVPYLADPLRSPVVNALRTRTVRTMSSIAIARLEQSEAERIRKLEQTIGFHPFSANLPLVFRHVLSRSADRRDILEIALDVRDSSHARRFRRFCGNADEAMASGDIDAVERTLRELTSAGIVLDENLSRQRPTMTAELFDASKELVNLASPVLGALIPGVKATVDHAPRLLSRFRLAFINDLRRTPRAIGNLEREFEAAWPDRLRQPRQNSE